ncbi:MAG: transcriptional regulator [Pusillimonas sp.]|nr:transcriptional regulator [Pusillimonas sp.]|tara:strand:+ start:14313 stop:14558 length:246 start_codon:yes stop_codon:yes gene_type:complete
MNDSESLNEFLIKFGEKVKKERESRGLTLDDLEFHSSIDSSDINKIELGQRNITMKSLIRISHGLKVHPKELLDIEFMVSE